MTNTELWVKILNEIEHVIATDFYSIYRMDGARSRRFRGKFTALSATC